MDCFLKKSTASYLIKHFVSLICNPRDPITSSEDDWGVQKSPLKRKAFIGSMKPFSVSVSQDLWGPCFGLSVGIHP